MYQGRVLLQGATFHQEMRLTADLIERSASFINAVDDRELDLRGNYAAVQFL